MARTAIAGMVAAAVLAGGCGGDKTLGETNIEDDIEAELVAQGTQEPQVVCPDDVAVTDGAEFECSVTPGGGTAATAEDYDVAVTLVGTEGEFELATG